MCYDNVEYNCINVSVFCEYSYVYLDSVKGGGVPPLKDVFSRRISQMKVCLVQFFSYEHNNTGAEA